MIFGKGMTFAPSHSGYPVGVQNLEPLHKDRMKGLTHQD